MGSKTKKVQTSDNLKKIMKLLQPRDSATVKKVKKVMKKVTCMKGGKNKIKKIINQPPVLRIFSCSLNTLQLKKSKKMKKMKRSKSSKKSKRGKRR